MRQQVPSWTAGHHLTTSPVSAFRWRRVDLPRRQGLAYRFRPELGEDRPQRADARREGVAVVLDDIVKLLGQSGGFVVRQVEHHLPQIGRFIKPGQPAVGNGGMRPDVSPRERGERNVGTR